MARLRRHGLPIVMVGLSGIPGCLYGNTATPGGVATADAGAPGTDPRGSDAMLSFSWRINGQDPRTGPAVSTDPCRDAGVQFIRMSVVDGQNQAHTYSSFQWDCHLGTYRSAHPELRAGMFQVYWEAVTVDGRTLSLAPARLDASGTVVPAPEPAVFVPGQVYDFDQGNTAAVGTPGQPTNFATGSGPLDVTLDYQPAGSATPTTCSGAGVATVSWQLLASNGVAVENHTQAEPCSQYQHIHWNQVNWDTYTLAVTARDASGAVTLQDTCLALLASRSASASTFHCTVHPAQP